jgi:hypothetical protein
MMMSPIMAGGYNMLIRSIALAMVMFIPTNITWQGAGGKIEHVTAAYYNPAPIVWEGPELRTRSPGAEVWDMPEVIAEVIIPRAKPEIGKLTKSSTGTRKCWRTLKGGHKSYRLRKMCRPGERAKP